MSEFNPPMLGFGLSGDPPTVIWKDGTVICRGILGDMSPETRARELAEEARKEELRSHDNVVLLSDYRQGE